MRNDLLLATACAGCVASVIIVLGIGGTVTFERVATIVARSAQSAAVFFVQSITIAQIQDTYHGVVPSSDAPARKVRVLIVPGHQPGIGGTEFNAVYERDVVVDIADALASLLARNPHYEVMVARTKTAWNPILQSYFDTHAVDIEAFRQSQAIQMASYLSDGSVLPEADRVYHTTASSQAALQLYGINKWASENKYDITLHLHLNDYAGRRAHSVGKYDGFTIYVPDYQYSNAEASKAIGNALAIRLNAFHATSTLPQEDSGVVEDQELIATGSNNSADGAALLIEYGYIYEPQFQNSSILPVAVADYSYQTYLGLQDFFKDPLHRTFGSVSFHADWTQVTGKKNERGAGVYALQATLHYLSYYPPENMNFSECPISGIAGSCTRLALEQYQSAHGLEATGIVGPKTRAALEKDLASP